MINWIKTRWWLVALVVLIFLSVIAWRVFAARSQTTQQAEIVRAPIQETLTLSGILRATEYAQLKFEISGRLLRVNVKQGDAVKKDQLLANLDLFALNAAHEQAIADLRSAQASAEKALDDVKNHSADESYAQKETRTKGEAARDRAYRALEIARDNIRKAYLKAPFAGVVTAVTHPFAGGIPIISTENQIELLNPDTIYFEVLADQTEVTQLRLGQATSVILDAFEDATFSGKIIDIGLTPKAGEASTVYPVKVQLSNLSLEQVRIGMGGDANFILQEKSDVLVVPADFLNSDAKGQYLLVGPTKRKTYIQTGIEGEEFVEVLEGPLKAGDLIYD